MKEFALKVHQLSHYTPEIVSIMRARIRKFSLSLSRDMVLKCKAIILNNDTDISWLVVYI